MSTYEIVAVLRPDLDEEGLGAAIERIHQRIGEHGGTVQRTDRWGKRKTAYAIRKYRDGYYVLTVFTLESDRVAPLRHTLGLHEDLLRFTVAAHHPSPVPAPTPAAAGTPPGSPPAGPAPIGPPPALSPTAPAAAPPAATGRAHAAPEEGSHV